MDSVILEKTRSEVKIFHFDFRGTHPNSILVNCSDELESNGSVGLEERIIFIIPRKTENWEVDNQNTSFCPCSIEADDKSETIVVGL